MMEQLGELLSYEFNRRALLAAALIGFTNGYLSGFVVLRRSALVIGAISQSLFPGLAMVAILFGGLTLGSGLLGALGAALVAGLGSILIAQRSPIDRNSALAILYTTGFAGGILMLHHSSVRAELQNWLFGNILGLADSDLWLAWAISGAALLTLTSLQRPLLLLLFEPSVAASQGVPVRFLDALLMVVTVLALVSSLQAIGCILSIGLMVIPAATVRLFAPSPRIMFWGGAFLGAGISVLAVVVSNLIADVPTGAAVVAMLGSVFGIGLVIRTVRDWVVNRMMKQEGH